MGMIRRRAPVSSQSICQGTMLEWCSIAEMRISSPAPTLGRAKLWATRLMPSVVPRTKMISFSSAAWMKRRTLARRVLVCPGGPFAQEVNAAVDIGAVAGVKADERIDDRLGFLGGGGVVEVDQRLAVDLLMQGREVAPDSAPLDRDAPFAPGRRARGFHIRPFPPSPLERRSSSTRSSWHWRGLIFMALRMSPANA